ncbi:(2Fe-2S)-binding protein [Nonomuraea pusilla]|uniref:(2Fe-2S)-binding protein n=1 Tax=Nonomuraea pusilla TaxID=46177 RepID=UPI003323022F
MRGSGPAGGITRDDLTDLHAGLPPAPTPAVLHAIADVSRAGARFELDVGPAEAGWRPLADLTTDPAVLEARIAAVAEHLGTAESRVAASLLFQKAASRLYSPLFGAAVAHGLLLHVDPLRVHWRPAPGGALPLRAADPAGWEAPAQERTAEALYATVVTGLLEPLADAVRAAVKIAPGLLWGNVASALGGTLRAFTRERPEHSEAGFALTRRLLELGRLRGTGDLTEPAAGRPLFMRRSCCLYYRVPGDMCDDCSLTDAGRRHG